MLAVTGERDRREFVESRFPLRLQYAGEMALGVARIGPGQRIQRGRDHQLQVALRQHLVGIFEVEHLALLGNAQLPFKRIHRLGKDGAMRRPTATTDSPAAAVKQPQLHAAFARHFVQRTMRAENLPRTREHASIFVRVGVAEHYFLPVVPTRDQLAVIRAAP